MKTRFSFELAITAKEAAVLLYLLLVIVLVLLAGPGVLTWIRAI